MLKWKGIVEYSSVDNTTYNNLKGMQPEQPDMLESSAKGRVHVVLLQQGKDYSWKDLSGLHTTGKALCTK